MKKRQTTLAQLDNGESAQIKGFSAGTGLRRRLEELGMREGKKVTKISGMPFRGAVVVQVGGTRIALGHGMASKVLVGP